MPGTSKEQVVDKGIRQKSTKEWTHSLTAVPFIQGHRSVFPQTPRNTGVYTRHPTFVTATSGVLTRLPAKLSKNGMRVYTLPVRQAGRKKKLRVYVGAICRSERSTDRAALLEDLLKIYCSRSHRSIAQRTGMVFARSTDRAEMVLARSTDRACRKCFCAIGRLFLG